MRRAAVAAGILVAVDPLLLKYTTQVMTEVCFTFLTLLLLLALPPRPTSIELTSAEPKGFHPATLRSLLPRCACARS